MPIVNFKSLKDKWMEREGVKEYPLLTWPCLGKVLFGQRHNCDSAQAAICALSQKHSHSWFDHPTFFKKNGKLILTAQPYTDGSKFKAMQQTAALWGLTVTESQEDSWWFPGSTRLYVWQLLT